MNVEKKEDTKTINIAPKWEYLLPLYAEWFSNGTEEQHDLAVKEFIKVGKILDKINDGTYILTEKGEEDNV